MTTIEEAKQQLCKCGCKRPTTLNQKTKTSHTWIHGHNANNGYRKPKIIIMPHLCHNPNCDKITEKPCYCSWFCQRSHQTTLRNRKGIWTGKKHSEKTKKKLSRTRKTLIKQGLIRPSMWDMGPGKLKEHTEQELIMERLLKPLGFKQEVIFRTGTKGLQIYGAAMFRADFYHERKQIVVELDGKSHLMERSKDRDLRKDRLLKEKYNCRVLRFNTYKEFVPEKIVEVIKCYL